MTPKETVTALWERIQSRDWVGMRQLLAGDLQVYWPASQELITGPDRFVSVQSEYPEGWSIRVLNVLAVGETVVSEVEVPQEGIGVFRVVSIWTVQGGLICAGREYWVTVGGDTPPEWRQRLARVLALDERLP